MWAGHVVLMVEKKCIQILVGKFRGREHLENVSIDGNIILKWILKI
jgi:hypothetical protein